MDNNNNDYSYDNQAADVVDNLNQSIGETPSLVTFSMSSMSDLNEPIDIQRPVLTLEDVYQSPLGLNFNSHNYNREQQQRNNNMKKRRKSMAVKQMESMKEFYQRQLYKFSFKSMLFNFLPILQWLPSYNFGTNLVPDIIAGCTVLALNIPQGLAYGHLAGAEPINGLYVSLFPVIVYAFFGTSRHISIGTFSVISIACKDVLESFELGDDIIVYTPFNETTTLAPNTNLKPIDILTALCLLVGIIQLILGLLRLGILSMILSDTLISAFVVASAIHVFTQQIFELVGIESSSGDDYELPLPMDIVNAYINFFRRIGQTNIYTLILSLICGTLLVCCKKVLEPWIMKKLDWKTIALPIDMTLVIVVTLMSKLMDFHGKYDIRIIQDIPEGFTGMPKVPPTNILAKMIPGALLICLISYIFAYSLGQMYGKKHGYKINPNQELIALGAANTVSSFFLCYPCCASLSRSAVQDSVGGRTQVVSFVNSGFMIVILFFLSTYLKTLPKCVLACIITMALYSTFKRFREAWTAWKDSILEGILWTVSFLLVLLFGVSHGLLYAIIFSMAILIVKLVTPSFKLKYRYKNSELFIEIEHKRFDYAREKFFHCFSKEEYIDYNNISNKNNLIDNGKVRKMDGWIVFEFQGPLIFINSLLFRTKFYSMIGQFIVELYERDPQRQQKIFIILDCSRMTYIDAKGTEAILDTVYLMHKYNAQIVLAGCSQLVFENLEKFKFFEKFQKAYCYMSVMDAIKDN